MFNKYDVKEILDEANIDYKESGKNVGAYDVNIDCPFCGSDKHLGIKRHSGQVNCWVCKFSSLTKHPSLQTVIISASGLNPPDVYQIIKNNTLSLLDSVITSEPDIIAEIGPDISIFQDFFNPKQPAWRDKALSYLTKRDFGISEIVKFGLRFCTFGKYAYRIIIPVMFKNKLVSFTTRDFMDRNNEPRYKHLNSSQSIVRLNEVLYGWDMFEGKHLRLVEGPTDVWRLAKTSLGVFKSYLSSAQLSLIVGTKLDSMSVLFDPDAYGRALDAAERLSPFIKKIKIVLLPNDSDVASMSVEDIYREEENTTLFSE